MKALIVGIDPGTTVGVAVLDSKGTLLATKSRKNWPNDEIVDYVHQFGKVIIVGTDKKKVPSMVTNIGAAFNARIIPPKFDLRGEDKLNMTREAKLKNHHEEDALASAKFAFGRFNKLLSNVARFANERDLPHLTPKLQEIVVKKKINRYDALEYLSNMF
jgi:predicted RNase H-like nuclease (RuvC/YqgF family)